MTLRLYNHDLDAGCYRVRLTASVLGLPLDLVGLDIFPGRDHLSDAMLALNPAGRLPVLTDGALVLTEPLAILWHLGTAHDPEQRLVPAQAALMLEWLAFATGPLAAADAARTASLTGRGDPAAPRAEARAALRRLEDHMTRQGVAGLAFAAGGTLTLADLALFPAFALSRDFGVDHDEYPALRLWARRVRTRPGFITMPGIPDYH